MSRIGKLPVILEAGIEVKLNTDNTLSLKKGAQALSFNVRPEIEVKIDDSQILLLRRNEEQKTKAYQGLYRSLIYNGVHGLSKGWKKSLKFNGVGYKANVKGEKLELNLGYSHPIIFDIPEDIDIKVEKNTTVHVSGVDRQKVGQVAAQIRDYRPPEPYLGKGVRYVDEIIVKKSGKSGAEKK